MIYKTRVLILISILFLNTNSCTKKDDIKKNDMTFAKSVEVFGIKILATKNTGDAKIIHAAKILAQYLDNDENGEVDNKLVVDKMTSVGATLVMFKDEDESEKFIYEYEGEDLDHAQALYDDETIITFNKNNSNSRFDASLEEVLHLITHEGYSKVYSELAEEKGSAIANAMDKARGGYFLSPPSKYPAGAWYSYDDETCTYDCMITEYFYWSLTSVLGAQAYPGRFDEIGHEWKLNTLEKVKSTDTDIYSILSNEKFSFPSILPDNIYNGFEITLKK